MNRKWFCHLHSEVHRSDGSRGCRSEYFRERVDPVALGIPTYFETIGRENARDLGLIKRKLEDDQYGSVDAVERDTRLIFRNCYLFVSCSRLHHHSLHLADPNYVDRTDRTRVVRLARLHTTRSVLQQSLC